jgi:F-type H+-transporting ATPase subunit gamma
MANSLREVKARINSTRSTAQITKAMHMVSQSKVKVAEKTYKSYQEFMSNVSSMVKRILGTAENEVRHQLLIPREVKKTAYFIITSDRGLAGAYNSSVEKELERLVKESNGNCLCGAIGRQGYNFIKRKGYELINDEIVYSRDDVMFVDIAPLAKKFIKLYLSGEIDKLVVVYNHYVNTLTQEVVLQQVLPINPDTINVSEDVNTNVVYSYESGVSRTIDLILPMYVEDLIYALILDAKTSEHASRMNSMRNATDNAEEVIGKLQLLYNRARQSVVTTELIDIIGGANAIGGDK